MPEGTNDSDHEMSHDSDEEEEVGGGGGGGGEEEEEEEVPLLPPLKRPRNQSVDQICRLHDSVLHHILSFLPIKEAVRTGILSKRWQYLWTSLSTLVFQNQDFQENVIREFVAFVNHTVQTLLLCRCASIRKFALDFVYRKCFASDVNLWIRFAAQNNVEDLSLHFGPPGVESDKHRLPQHLFTRSSLVSLSVWNCVVAPIGDVSWGSLKSLSMEYVQLSDEVIARILSRCPVLEFLKMSSCSGIISLQINSASLKKLVIQNSEGGRAYESMLEISAPKLGSLELLGPFGGRKGRLEKVPVPIANLNLTFDYLYAQDYKKLGKLVERLQHVQELQLGSWFIQFLSKAQLKVLPSPMSSCKILTLHTHIKKCEVPGIARLLQSSPCLETLVVDMSARDHTLFLFLPPLLDSCDYGENYWISHKRFFEGSLLHLKTIKIIGFGDVCGGFVFPLLQFLLENAKVLEKMVIKTEKLGHNRCSTCFVSKGFVQLTQKLLSFRRASPRAVVIFS